MRRDGKVQDDVPNAKLFRARVKKGDAFIVRSGGGGGFGSPLERPVETVQSDVEQGYVSLEAAKNYYGVVLHGETLAIDHDATKRQRAELQGVHLKRVSEQNSAPQRLDRKALEKLPAGHLAMRCLLPSCCGRWHVSKEMENAFLAEEVRRDPG